MDSNRLLIIDGNSIMNRAFYGIMSSKSLMSADGKYTNAVYGFLSILFKDLEDLKPDYIAVAFDLLQLTDTRCIKNTKVLAMRCHKNLLSKCLLLKKF